MIKYATVMTTAPFAIKFDGETVTSTTIYKRLGSYAPVVNDRVAVLLADGNYLVLGKVV